jgi:Ca2+-transporting ATPase
MTAERDADPFVAWALDSDEVLSRIGSGAAGLDPNEAAARLRSAGPNRLPEKRPRSALAVLASQLKGFLNLLLLVAAVIAWAVGDIKDAVMIGAVTLFNAVLGFVQEHRAEKALSALRRMGALRARVRRAGHVLEIAAEDLVPGDVVLLEPGERVPADGRLLFTHSLEVDESSLTGESEPAHKDWRTVLPLGAPLAERSNLVFMSSVVTRGRGELVVCATGRGTEIGRIAELLEQTERAPTPLQQQLDSLGKRIAVVALVVVAIISAVELARGDTLAQMALEAIALAVAAVPEGLPAVVTVTLALGLQRMARHRAIVKRLAAVETLGCTTTICSDKTGTLTMNQMSARAVWHAGRRFEVTGEGYGSDGRVVPESESDAPADFAELARGIVLCNDSRIVGGSLIGDPTEGALLALASKMGLPVEETRAEAPRIAEVPFESERRFMATFHEQGHTVALFVKGAPGVVMRRSKVDAATREAIEAENERMAATGLRVLAVASRRLSRKDVDGASDVA